MEPNEPKAGNKTTEFYLTLATNLINAVFMILIALGLITQEESTLWQALVSALLLAVLPIATMFVNKEYTKGRTAVKVGAMTGGNSITISPSIVEETIPPNEDEWVQNYNRPEATENS